MAASKAPATRGRATRARSAEPSELQVTLATVAGVLAVLGGIMIVAGLFPDYYGSPLSKGRDDAAFLGYYSTTGVGLVLAGLLLLRRRGRSQLIGATAVFVTALLFLSEFTSELLAYLEDSSGDPGFGFWLQLVGFGLMVAAAGNAAIALLGPFVARAEWQLRGRTRVVTIAAFLGLATGVGYGMNPYADNIGAFDSPLDPLFPRELWTYLLVVVALTAAPMLAALTQRWEVATGTALGFFTFVLAWNLDNLLFVYVDHPSYEAIEGTWTFLAAGLASVLVLLWSMALPRGRQPRPLKRREPAPGWLQLGAGLLAITGGVLEFASMFPRYFGGERFNFGSPGGTAMYVLLLAASMALAGVLMTRSSTRLMGTGALCATVVLFASEPVSEIVLVFEKFGPDPGFGFWIAQTGYLLATVGALAALFSVRGRLEPSREEWAVTRAILVGSTLLGFAAAVAFALNPFRYFGFSSGSPLEASIFTGPNPRSLWSVLLVIVAVPMIAGVALVTRRAIARGLLAALAGFVLAGACFRLGIAYAGGRHHDAEGTWMFVAAGPAVVLLLAYHLARNGSPSRAAIRTRA